eukprot:CAMPEP_0115862672 /NCGR_PEP_ID=MMETSP0287-20121206/18298_1 /TAXON_ID=412157 /ORGANISM="Chrysochromulina rotalis, Strain UIO044" /LENGTH=101 /DNA_ID=CAMNT_0003317103 /DNA_START=18 /DNA_END=323 /DNA_ORIENTATION=-
MISQFVALALAFAPSPQMVPPLALGRAHTAVPTVKMAGWNDPWEDSMRKGQVERMPRGRGSSKFENTLDKQEGSEVQKLGLGLAGFFAIILVPLFIQISQL